MDKINIKKVLLGVNCLLLLIILPTITFATLVTCDGGAGDACNIDSFIEMINIIINWFITMATVVFTISAIYGGYLYMTSGSNPGNKEKAKTVLLRTLTGFVIILTAWVIVHTILNALVPEGSTIFKFIGTGGIKF